MRAGQLRHRVEIQEYIQTENEIGDVITRWDTVARAWASIEPIRGQEKWEAMKMQAETTHKVIMRYIPDITPANRLLLGERRFEIEAVLNVEERNRFLELTCKEMLGDG